MSDASEFDNGIPGPPQRPDTKEFWQLSEIVLAHDAKSSEGEEAFLSIINDFIPIEVAEYMGLSRTLMMLEFGVIPELFLALVGPQVHALTSSGWLDGFAAGAAYQKKYGKEEA